MKKIIFTFIFFILFVLANGTQTSSIYAQEACDPASPSCPDLPAFCESGQTRQCTGGYCDDMTDPANPVCARSCNPVSGDPLNCAGGGGGGGGGIIQFPSDLPLKPPSSKDPTALIGSVVTFIIYVLAALGVIASIIWLLYGAIKYITAGGDKAAIEGAKTHVVTALIGLIIVLFTFVIISLVLSVFGTGGLSGISFQLPSIF